MLALGRIMHPFISMVSSAKACGQWAIVPAGRPAPGRNHRRRAAQQASVPPMPSSTSVAGSGTAVIVTKACVPLAGA
jgi:hypothetical protein